MPRGAPDYGNTITSVSLANTDNSDIVAATLGYSRLDGRGRVIWWESFRDGLNKWQLQASGGATSPYLLSIQQRQFGNNAVVLLDPAVNGGTSQILTTVITPGAERIGVEFVFMARAAPGPLTCDLYSAIVDGDRKIGTIRINGASGVVDVNDNGTVRTVYTPGTVASYQTAWTFIKLVIDISTGKYARAVIGGNEFDISAYTLRTSGGYIDGQTSIVIGSSYEAGPVFGGHYVGYVILTIDEP